MSRQAPSVFEGSKYFGGQPSGPQTTSSWGGWGQTAPPQAAQPNHYTQQPHNSLQQTWNGFQPSYQGGGLQQQTSANQGSFMEEYSPKDSELDWFHTGAQSEQPNYNSNPEVHGYQEASLLVPAAPNHPASPAKPQSIVFQQGVNSFLEPALRNSPGDLYDHERAADESLDEESDTESRSITTSGSTSPEDANIEPGAAWLEEEIDDSELDAIHQQIGNTVEPPTAAGGHFTGFSQRDQFGHNVNDYASNQATFFDSPSPEIPSVAGKPALPVGQSQTDGQPVEPPNSQPPFGLRNNAAAVSNSVSYDPSSNAHESQLSTGTSGTNEIAGMKMPISEPTSESAGARLFDSTPTHNTGKAPAASFFNSPHILPVPSSSSANSTDKPPLATSFDSPQLPIVPNNSYAFGGDELQNLESTGIPATASFFESSHIPSVPNNASAFERNKLQNTESTGVSPAATFFDSPHIPLIPRDSSATASLFSASHIPSVPISSSFFGGNELHSDAQQRKQPAPVFEQNVKSVESSLFGRPQAFPALENATDFGGNEMPAVPDIQQHIEPVSAAEPTIKMAGAPISYSPQALPGFQGNEMQRDKHQRTEPFPTTQPNDSIPVSDRSQAYVPPPYNLSAFSKQTQPPPEPTGLSVLTPDQSQTLPPPSSLWDCTSEERKFSPEPSVPSFLVPPPGGLSAPINEGFQLTPKSSAPSFPAPQQAQILPPPVALSAPINEGFQLPPNSSAPSFPAPQQAQIIPPPVALSAPINEGFQLPPNSSAPSFPAPEQSQILPPPGGLPTVINDEMYLPSKSVVPSFPVPEQFQILPPPGGLPTVINDEMQLPSKSGVPSFPVPERAQIIPPPGGLSAPINERMQLPSRSGVPSFLLLEQSQILPPPGSLSAPVNDGTQLPPKPSGAAFPVPGQSQSLPPPGSLSAPVNNGTRLSPKPRAPAFPVPEQSQILLLSGLSSAPANEGIQLPLKPSAPSFPVPEQPQIPPSDTLAAPNTKQIRSSPESSGSAVSLSDHTQISPPCTVPAPVSKQMQFPQEPRRTASYVQAQDSNQPWSTPSPPASTSSRQSVEKNPHGKVSAQAMEQASTPPKQDILDPAMLQHRTPRAAHKEHAQASPCTSLWTSVPNTMPTMMLVAPVPSTQKSEGVNASGTLADQEISTQESSLKNDVCKSNNASQQDNKKCTEQIRQTSAHKENHRTAIRDTRSHNDRETREKEYERSEHQHRNDYSDSRGLQEHQSERKYNYGNDHQDIRESQSENLAKRSVPLRDEVRDTTGLQERQNERGNDPGSNYRDVRGSQDNHDERIDPSRDNVRNTIGSQELIHEKVDDRFGNDHGDSKGSQNYPERNDGHNIDEYRESRQSKDHERRDTRHSDKHRDSRQSQDYPERHDGRYSDSNSGQSRDRERQDARYNEDYRNSRRQSQDYLVRDDGRYSDEYRDSRQSKGHERWDARYGDDYSDSRQSRDFAERRDGRYSDEYRDSRKSQDLRERPGDRYLNEYSDLGNSQDHGERRDNHHEDKYRDTRYWQGHGERQGDHRNNERRDIRESNERRVDHYSNEYRDDREFQGYRELQDGYYGNEYRDTAELQGPRERCRDRYGDEYRIASRRSQERLADNSKEVDPYNEQSRSSEYSASRWQDHNHTWEDDDEKYHRNSQYSQGYSDRYTSVHSGRSTPVGYYDYAGPHYSNSYGYNYQWDNYWGQYQQYPHYYPGYPDYGYYYPDYADYSGYASSQDQSNTSGLDQYPGTDSHQPELQEQPTLQPESIPEPARLTPVPFPRPHMSCRFGPGGLLVTVHANHPLDGQRASLDISHVKAIFTEQEQRLMKIYPGPLSRHESVRKDVIRFATEMAEEALADYSLSVDQKQSVSVMWKFLGLLCKQNGMFSMADIAELLVLQHQELKRQAEAAAVTSSEIGQPDLNNSEAVSNKDQLDVTPGDEQEHCVGAVQGELSPAYAESNPLSAETKLTLYREMLITGSRKEALEFAMKGEMWGHALTLASKMDSRTFGNILARFQSSISTSDPLQTVYQHMSGRQPVAVTSGNEWMLHLAAMVGNASHFPDSDRRNITFLGDTLANDGLVYAAHLCYLLAGWSIGSTADADTKVALIGANHKLCQNPTKLFNFASFQMTEVLEYALTLKSEEFSLPAFQLYKFLYATKLSEAGQYGQAMHYLEIIAARMLLHPGQHNTVLVRQVHEMADRLQGFDEIARQSGDEGVNLEWIEMLNKLIQAKDSAMVLSQDSHEDTATTEGEIDPLAQSSTSFFSGYDSAAAAPAPAAEIPPLGETAPPEPQPEIPESGGSSFQQQPSWTLDHQASYSSSGAGIFEPQMSDNAELPPFQPGTPPQDEFESSHRHASPGQDEFDSFHRHANPGQDEFDSFHRHANPSMFKGFAVDEGPRFTQHMTPLFPSQPQFNETSKASVPEPAFENKKEKDPEKKETKPVKKEKAANGNQKGWFSGLFSKIIPKAGNEMKLPDDSKKTIYYDEDKGCWVNTEEDEADKTPLAPPPTDSQLMGGPPPPPASQMPGTPGPPGPFSGRASQPMAMPSPSAQRIQPGGPSHAPASLSAPMGSPQFQRAQTGAGSVPGRNVLADGGAGDEGPPPPPSKFSRKAHGLGRAGARNKYVDVLNPEGQKRSVEPPPSLLPIFPTATTSLPGNFFVPQPVSSGDADENANSEINAPQIANPSSRPASVGSEEGVEEYAVKQRSRSSSQSSDSLSQTSAEVRSYFDHTQAQAQPPYLPQEQQYDQQYPQQQQQQPRYNQHQQQQQQQQQQFQQPDQQQFVNSYNQFYGQPPQPTLPSQQQLPTQQQQHKQPPLQNQQQGQQYQFQDVQEDAQPAPPAAAPMMFNPAAFQTQPMSPSVQRRGRYARPRT